MIGHCILSHGLDSSPDATKVSAMAKVAQTMGWTSERLDYRDIDATRDIREVSSRVRRLVDAAHAAPQPLVLAGSSMGAYISALATLEVDCIGLFLMAPPIALPGYPTTLAARNLPTTVIHGWHDELIPAADVVLWSKMRSDHLILVDDDHRLSAHVDFVAQEFGRFLARLQ
ncbi:YqiA/YcfP family alpha/beta fold hydrolase [Chiayiivirga flava]|uniref:Putative alpha/beta-hydrolase family hydrolase n=1 Tax=Chiayiivirga flava TaxID=659595 RepID=A0A7W8D923_9GAMM|nr:YqiA/YcfP family alpha/beta fold hydrolase [Chiayiivirga flava]MBB5209027.1 putative alpha/beta-hydrolase family hydrolase [Chiayiivirga flava]